MKTKTIRVNISPSGNFKHIYNDSLRSMDEAMGNFEVHRASDIYFDNALQCWKIKILATDEVLPEEFKDRAEALSFEHDYLQTRVGSA